MEDTLFNQFINSASEAITSEISKYQKIGYFEIKNQESKEIITKTLLPKNTNPAIIKASKVLSGVILREPESAYISRLLIHPNIGYYYQGEDAKQYPGMATEPLFKTNGIAFFADFAPNTIQPKNDFFLPEEQDCITKQLNTYYPNRNNNGIQPGSQE